MDGDGTIGAIGIVLRRAIAQAREDRLTTSAQAVAYSLFLSIPSVLLVAVGAFSLVADGEDVARLIERAETIMPAEAAALLGDSLERSTQSTGTGLLMTMLGGVLALWSTTSAASTLMDAIASSSDRRDQRSFAHRRAIALAVVACLVLAAALVIGLLVLGPYLERWAGAATDAPTLAAWTWWTAQWPILIGGLLLAFATVLSLGAGNERPGWRTATPGAVVAVVIWIAASGGFALYTANFGSYNKTWGSLSAVVVTLIWLWLTSAALLFGAQVNVEVRRRVAERGARPPSEAPGRDS